MKRSIIVCATLFLTCCYLSAASIGAQYNVRDYGAKGDGVTIDSKAINAAIDAAANAGGGTVYFPAGKYASYSIRLKNNITLFFDRGSVLYAAKETETGKYDAPEANEFTQYQDFGHSHWQNSLIWGIDLHDISIVGFGLINGTDGLTRGERGANKTIALKNCRNVTIRDVSILMAGHFALLATGVDNMTIDNVMVDSNRDGFDIDCCRNVRISNCYVNCLQDDAIVLKSSFGLGEFRPCENITITNCQVTGYDPGSFLDGTFKRSQEYAPDRDGPTGRIKLGTESNGGFKNITVSNCVFDRSRGIALETVDGAPIENITYSNIAMRDICNSVIFIRLGNRARAPEGTPHSIIKGVNISDVVAYDVDSRYSLLITGLPNHLIEDVTISNLKVYFKGGLSMQDATEQKIGNAFFHRGDPSLAGSREPYNVPEAEKGYPEPSIFGVLPASAMYIRHAKNVRISNVEIGYAKEDTRPSIVVEDVDGISFKDMYVKKAANAPFFVLKDVKSFSTKGVEGFADTQKAEVKERQEFLNK